MILLLLLAGMVQAAEYTFIKPVVLDTLAAEAKAAGYGDVSFYCVSGKCTMTYDDSVKLDPADLVQAHVYADPKIAATAEVDSIKTLAARIDTATVDDLRNLLKLLLKHNPQLLR